MRKWFYRSLFVICLLVLALVGSCLLLSKARPTGKPSAAADALARKVEKAIHKKAWDQVGVIQWDFAGRQQHLWDKKRMFSRVTFHKGHVVALFPLSAPSSGFVAVDGKDIKEPIQKKKLLQKAYAFWANDSFWLNPLAKMFDDGTTRKLVTWEGKTQLMIDYASGGVTPGDGYLYVLDKDFLPSRWHMWVKILPVQGVTATFRGWKTLYNGAKISTRHKLLSLVTLNLTKIKAADSVQKLLGSDPFARLVQGQNPQVRSPTTRRGPSTSRPTR